MKIDMNIVPLEATQPSEFLSCHEQYQLVAEMGATLPL
jgi:hypothetical protein